MRASSAIFSFARSDSLPSWENSLSILAKKVFQITELFLKTSLSSRQKRCVSHYSDNAYTHLSIMIEYPSNKMTQVFIRSLTCSVISFGHLFHLMILPIFVQEKDLEILFIREFVRKAICEEQSLFKGESERIKIGAPNAWRQEWKQRVSSSRDALIRPMVIRWRSTLFSVWLGCKQSSMSWFQPHETEMDESNVNWSLKRRTNSRVIPRRKRPLNTSPRSHLFHLLMFVCLTVIHADEFEMKNLHFRYS